MSLSVVASHRPVTSTSSSTRLLLAQLLSLLSSLFSPLLLVHLHLIVLCTRYLLSSLDSLSLGKSCHCPGSPTSSPLSGLSCPPAFHLAPTTTPPPPLWITTTPIRLHTCLPFSTEFLTSFQLDSVVLSLGFSSCQVVNPNSLVLCPPRRLIPPFVRSLTVSFLSIVIGLKPIVAFASIRRVDRRPFASLTVIFV